MRHVTWLILLALSFTGCICGKAEEAIKERVAKEVANRVTNNETGEALKVLRNIVNTKKNLKEVEVALTNTPKAPVVNWRKLAPFLPDELAGFSATKDLKGKTAAIGTMKATTVKRRYADGKRKLRLEIIDTSLAPVLRVGFATWKAYSEDSTEGLKKAIKVDGHQALLNWRKRNKKGEVTVLVEGRFMVKATLKPAKDPRDVVAVVKKMDLAKLSKMKAEDEPAEEKKPAEKPAKK